MIRSILYLDEQKMYSLSSQIFEGITEYVLSESAKDTQQSETQKGPVASGRVLAEVINSSSKFTEKRFLHDYSYSIFEKQLIDERKVLSISNQDLLSLKGSIHDFSFIKVKARAVFNDVDKINELIERFNALGESITFLVKSDEIKEEKAKLEALKSQTKDKAKHAQYESAFKEATNISRHARAAGLYQEPKFLESLLNLTKYAFSDQFEIQQRNGDVLYTSLLKRECLREKEELLVKKYSRKTEKNIVVFGLITQAFKDDTVEATPEEQEMANMKVLMMNLIEHFASVEFSLTGTMNNEVVIDPIAVYVEL